MTEIKAEITALTRVKRARQLDVSSRLLASHFHPGNINRDKVFGHFMRARASMPAANGRPAGRPGAHSEITCIKAKQRNGSRNNNVCL